MLFRNRRLEDFSHDGIGDWLRNKRRNVELLPKLAAFGRSGDEGHAGVRACGVDAAAVFGSQERAGHARSREDPAGIEDGKPRGAPANGAYGIDPWFPQDIGRNSLDYQMLAAQAAAVTDASRFHGLLSGGGAGRKIPTPLPLGFLVG